MTTTQNDGLRDYVKLSSSSSFLKETKAAQTKLHNHIDVYIKDSLPKGFDIEGVLTKIEQVLPASLMQDIDAVHAQSGIFRQCDFVRESAVLVRL